MCSCAVAGPQSATLTLRGTPLGNPAFFSVASGNAVASASVLEVPSVSIAGEPDMFTLTLVAYRRESLPGGLRWRSRTPRTMVEGVFWGGEGIHKRARCSHLEQGRGRSSRESERVIHILPPRHCSCMPDSILVSLLAPQFDAYGSPAACNAAVLARFAPITLVLSPGPTQPGSVVVGCASSGAVGITAATQTAGVHWAAVTLGSADTAGVVTITAAEEWVVSPASPDPTKFRIVGAWPTATTAGGSLSNVSFAMADTFDNPIACAEDTLSMFRTQLALSMEPSTYPAVSFGCGLTAATGGLFVASWRCYTVGAYMMQLKFGRPPAPFASAPSPFVVEPGLLNPYMSTLERWDLPASATVCRE